MAAASPNLFVSVTDTSALVKVVGRANFASSVSFKTLILELKERGFDSFLLDLAECVTMDSTFLGVLAGLASKLSDPKSKPPSSTRLLLVNPNIRIVDLLENLGVAHLFEVCHQDRADADAPLHPHVETESPSREQLSETCLEAHQALMALNPANVAKFKEVAQFLAEDLKKLKQTSPPAPPQSSPPQP